MTNNTSDKLKKATEALKKASTDKKGSVLNGTYTESKENKDTSKDKKAS